MSNPRILSLCSGVGALDLGVMDAIGGTVVGHAQYDPDDKHQWAAKILEHRFPGVPNHGDITAADWTPLVGSVDVITAGFPCQDISLAGAKAGLMPGTRSGIWSHVMRAIAALQPRLVVIENVRSLLSARAHSDVELCPWCLGDEPDQLALRGLGAVLGDLADGGFDAEWRCVPASDVGAPHLRWRVFILAWPADVPNTAGLGHGDPWPQSVGGIPAAAIGGRAAADGSVPSVALGVGRSADSEGDGRDQRRTEPARIIRGPDAAVSSGATPADPASLAEREPTDHPHPVAGSRETRTEPVDRSLPDRERERERTTP
jgi:DNA (cytosine-5)-methyltransferase 1